MVRIRIAVALAVLAGAGSVAAAENLQPVEKPGYKRVTVAEFKALKPNDGNGKRFTLVYLKFNKIFRTELKLDGGKKDGRTVYHPLAGRLHIQDRALIQKLGANRDSADSRLMPKRSNLQVFGVGRATARGLMLIVNEVRLLDSQLDRYARAHQALADGDFAARRALAAQIEAEVATYDDDREAVQPLLRTLRKEAQAAERAQLPALPDGADAWLEFGKRNADVDLLAELWASGDVSDEVRQRAEALLRDELGARRLRGKWLTREAFLEANGFVKATDGWIPEELAALQAEEQSEQRGGRPPFVQIKELWAKAAAQGSLVRGMPKVFAVAALKKADGAGACFPARVERYAVDDKGTSATWELWVMPTGRRVFFYKGVLTSHVEPKAAKEGSE